MQSIQRYQEKALFATIGLIVAVLLTYLTLVFGLIAPIGIIVLGASLVFVIIVIKNPFIGLMATLIYCFIVGLFAREMDPSIPFSYVVEILYLLLWIAILFKVGKSDWKRISNDICYLFLIWFLLSVLEVFNPGTNPRSGLSEIRSSGLDSFVLVPAGFMLIRNKKQINVFLIVILVCSLLGSFIGIKQLKIGLSPGEQAWLEANPTHMIWGQLRVFSFYRDAGQFGASQAAFAVIAGILAFGPFKIWKRILFGLLALIFFYGMLISGTRGSFFALVPGALLGLFLFKRTKVIIGGVVFLTLFVAILKFTYIGSSFSYVHRLRSALDPQDASLNLRFINQEILADYLKSYPFGGGLGTMGYAGEKYNPGSFLSTVAPDSYWVKVWGMYGIIGFTFWFCMMGYIIGKCCGLVWNIYDDGLRVKMIALTASFFAIFICSYGNEVINAAPSSIVSYLSLGVIFRAAMLDRESDRKKATPKLYSYAI